MDRVKFVCDDFEAMSDKVRKDLLLYGDSRFDGNKNKIILKATTSYIRNSERSGSLFW